MTIPRKVKRYLIGEMVGFWRVVSYVGIAKNKAHQALWRVVCTKCDREFIRNRSNLAQSKSSMCMSCSNKNRKAHKSMHKPRKHLYVVRCGRYIKIGTCDNYTQRATKFRAENPQDVELVGLYEGSGYVEHTLHTKLERFWHRGEWFLDTPMANKIIHETMGPICEFKQ